MTASRETQCVISGSCLFLMLLRCGGPPGLTSQASRFRHQANSWAAGAIATLAELTIFGLSIVKSTRSSVDSAQADRQHTAHAATAISESPRFLASQSVNFLAPRAPSPLWHIPRP